MNSSQSHPRLYEFGPFRLHVEGRALWSDGRVVQLTPKVFDTLLFLVERQGNLVRKEELIEALWPESFVEEHNLTQNIFVLRKALGDGESGRRYIQTMPKVGYRFIADVRVLPHTPVAEGRAAEITPANHAVPADVSPDDAGETGVKPAAREADEVRHRKVNRGRPRLMKTLAFLAGLMLVAVGGLTALLLKRSRDRTFESAISSVNGGAMRAGVISRNRESKRLLETGLYLWNQRSPDGIKKSVVYFQKAIEREPNNALAHALLADSYYLIYFYGISGFDNGEAYRKSVEAASASLERDPSLAEAHAIMGLIHRNNGPAAETYFRRSIELNPSLATTRLRYGLFLVRNGRLEEGLTELQRAYDLAPTSPPIIFALANTLFLSRRYDEAIDLCRGRLDVDANDDAARVDLAMYYIQKGMRAEAEAELRRIEGVEGGRLEALRLAGYMNALAGDHAEARRLAHLFETEANAWPTYWAFSLAGIYAAMGEEEAITYLTQAGDLITVGPEFDRDMFLTKLLFSPEFDRLRGKSRFKELLRRYGLG
jgi:DNA-binding winged helix-turn-helix (wHTH) protein/Tfp pilus assembly protein PilF